MAASTEDKGDPGAAWRARAVGHGRVIIGGTYDGGVMMMRARRAIPVGILIAVAVACGGGSKTPATSSTTPTPTASAHPTPSLAGNYTVTATSCLHIRKQPTLAAGWPICAPAGSVVHADGTSRKAEGYTWLHVTYNKVSGWAASTYLKRGGPSPSAGTSP